MAHVVKRSTIVWKKAILGRDRYPLQQRTLPWSWPMPYCLVKLKIPKGALVRQRINKKNHQKNRANMAQVLGIYHYKLTTSSKFVRKKTDREIARSMISATPPVIYRLNKIVRPRRAFDMSNNICASGIHFFSTWQRAIRY